MTQSAAVPSKLHWPSTWRATPRWRLVLAAIIALLALIAAYKVVLGVLPPTSGAWRTAVEAELVRTGAPPAVRTFYEARDYRPLWIDRPDRKMLWRRPSLGPEAAGFASTVAKWRPAWRGQLAATLDASSNGEPATLARAEVMLSLALGDYVRGLRRTVPVARLAFMDPGLTPPADTAAVLADAARAPSLAEHLARLKEVNPVYRSLRDGLAAYRARWSRLPQVHVPSGPTLRLGDGGERVEALRSRLGLAVGPGTRLLDRALQRSLVGFQAAHGLPRIGTADARTIAALNAGAAYYERLITANLERARALPPIAGRRFILVNVAAAELWLYQDGKVQGVMRVGVGTRRAQTPMMAGLIRYLVFNPYWNIPVDLVRDSLAPKILKLGPSYLETRHMQALSDWSDRAVPLRSSRIDWHAVASGKVELRVRQRPGGDNMMGSVKFMLPNHLGIYLHDTPEKADFRAAERLVSAGCVRLERASDLAAWLLGSPNPQGVARPLDQRVDLAQATPVYITYLTAAPDPRGVAFYPDAYGRDATLLASLS